MNQTCNHMDQFQTKDTFHKSEIHKLLYLDFNLLKNSFLTFVKQFFRKLLASKIISEEYKPTCGGNITTVILRNGIMTPSVYLPTQNVKELFFKWWENRVWPDMQNKLTKYQAFDVYVRIFMTQKYKGNWNTQIWSSNAIDMNNEGIFNNLIIFSNAAPSSEFNI